MAKPSSEIKSAPKQEPVVEKEEPRPVPVEKKPEPKAEIKTEPKKEVKEDVKEEVKVEPKKEVKEEPKPKPVAVEKKAESKPVEKEAKADAGVVFKVQLFALKTAVKQTEYNKAIKLFSPVSTETLPNGITRYYGGNVKTYTGVKKILEQAKTSGYPDAYIVGFKDGNRMSAEQMKAYDK